MSWTSLAFRDGSCINVTLLGVSRVWSLVGGSAGQSKPLSLLDLMPLNGNDYHLSLF